MLDVGAGGEEDDGTGPAAPGERPSEVRLHRARPDQDTERAMSTATATNSIPGGAPVAVLLAGTTLAPEQRSPIIGFRTADGGVAGLSDIGGMALRKLAPGKPDITLKGLVYGAAATAIAVGATAVRGVNLAIAEVEYSREQMEATLATMARQRDEAVERAAWLEELLLRQQAAAGPLLAGVAPVVATLPEGARKAAKPRWTAAERDLLLELRAGGMSYPKIATALGTGRSAAAVGAKWRALGAKAEAPAKPAKRSREARKAA